MICRCKISVFPPVFTVLAHSVYGQVTILCEEQDFVVS